MEKTDALKARIAELAPRMPFYLYAEFHTQRGAPEGTCNYDLAGQCGEWSRWAKLVFEHNGLEVLPMCTAKSRISGPNHAFLLVRDPATEAVVYYDPAAEQFGVIGAHKRAFTREDIAEHNRMCDAHWLENPIIFEHWKIDPDLRHDWEKVEAMRKVWGEEIHYDIPRNSGRSSNFGTNTRFLGL